MKILAIVRRIIKQIFNDKRTLALMLVAPLLILSLMDLVFNSDSTTNIKLGIYNVDSSIITTLEDNNFTVTSFDDNYNITDKIKDNSLDGFLSISDDKIEITYKNSDATKTKQTEGAILSAFTKSQVDKLKDAVANLKEAVKTQQQLIIKLNPQAANNLNNNSTSLDGSNSTAPEIINNYVYGDENNSIFDSITPTLIGFFVFFFVFLISGISLLKERTTGTLTKLLASPIKRYEIILGYLIGYGLFAIIQTFVVVLFAVYVLKVSIAGNIILVLLTNVLLAFVALSLGIFLSTFANSEFQMMQFIPLVILPQILFSGMISLDNMASWIKNIAHCMPVYYGSEALKAIMVTGDNFSMISTDLGVLLAFTVAFTILNILGLKRYRTI